MIRPAAPGDIRSVVDLALSSGLFPPEEVAVVQTLMADYFAGKQSDGHACLLDEEEGEPFAVAYYEPAVATDRTWYLTMIGVRADVQGGGRGGALLHRLEQDLRATGQRLLLVETSGLPSFARTRKFYAGCGYEQEATVRDYYGPGDDMVIFRKQLGGCPG